MAARVGQHNFSKGVLTKELWGRSDIAPYNAAVRQGLNVVVLKYGGLAKRQGTRFIYEVKDGPGKLFPFEGAYDASYCMLATQAAMRFAARGGMVLEQLLTVQAVTLGNPTVIRANFHGFSTGQEVFFNGVLGATWLNGRILPLTKIDNNNFSVPIDSTGLSPLTGDTGGTVRGGAPPADPAPPAVPAPAPAPTPPATGSGGGGSPAPTGGDTGGSEGNSGGLRDFNHSWGEP
jgi:hypothetical protein